MIGWNYGFGKTFNVPFGPPSKKIVVRLWLAGPSRLVTQWRLGHAFTVGRNADAVQCTSHWAESSLSSASSSHAVLTSGVDAQALHSTAERDGAYALANSFEERMAFLSAKLDATIVETQGLVAACLARRGASVSWAPTQPPIGISPIWPGSKMGTLRGMRLP